MDSTKTWEKMYINGNWLNASNKEMINVVNPESQEVMTAIPRGQKQDVAHAVTAAKKVFESESWQSLKPSQRGRALNEIAAKLRENKSELAKIETSDTGKPLAQSESDVENSARYFEYYAGMADKMFGETIPVEPGILDYTIREPIGVSAQIIPWNYPLQIASRSIAAAIATGNTVVVKPAEDASLSILALGRLIAENETLKSALQIVTGYGHEAGDALINHPDIDHITFTGSYNTGVKVMMAAAKQIVPVTLELGGKSPHIVFEDSDLDEAAQVIVRSFIQNAGQTCSAGSRLIVHHTVKEQLLTKLVKLTESISIGPGSDNNDLGPIISKKQFDRIQAMVEQAKLEGAHVITGGRPAEIIHSRGLYYLPTILNRISPKSEIAQEEVFGPVLTVFDFETESEAVDLANGTDYGLVTGIWTNDISRAHRVSNKVKSGQVFINNYGAAGGVEMPFGGYKKSGIGREKGVEALQNYTQLKNIAVKVT
ncbi:aldehyde dehydrogenase family protein [Alkalihalophilus lindianensis]|uniref:Aldehyde dehydrogenase n=1 Tax=Alkalihalophilus lindianensis TaxID=1630542 RepID=A0ABU3X739_9BACI|nr:aldehyde dehydrogenase family protein [Alkalihalophilus lindianensis]MDV2683623.1 aldehyde dehydrogenase family protein [Alkalihalophilus lindianensis]